MNNEVNIIDNFLDKKTFNVLKNALEAEDFPWFYNNEKSYVGVKDSPYNFQFTHMFYKNNFYYSNYLNLIVPLVEIINPKSLIRVKANLTTRTEEKYEYGYHLDTDFNCTTAILYINTNNGGTLFENENYIESKENRFVFFNSELEHTGVSCTDEKRRIVININYF